MSNSNLVFKAKSCIDTPLDLDIHNFFSTVNDDNIYILNNKNETKNIGSVFDDIYCYVEEELEKSNIYYVKYLLEVIRSY